jgi:hypothetical protein
MKRWFLWLLSKHKSHLLYSISASNSANVVATAVVSTLTAATRPSATPKQNPIPLTKCKSASVGVIVIYKRPNRHASSMQFHGPVPAASTMHTPFHHVLMHFKFGQSTGSPTTLVGGVLLCVDLQWINHRCLINNVR